MLGIRIIVQPKVIRNLPLVVNRCYYSWIFFIKLLCAVGHLHEQQGVRISFYSNYKTYC